MRKKIYKLINSINNDEKFSLFKYYKKITVVRNMNFITVVFCLVKFIVKANEVHKILIINPH